MHGGTGESVTTMMSTHRATCKPRRFALLQNHAFLTGNYNLEKHQSDVYDQFQLHYLALERFVIVSGDSDLSKRTLNSHQADRIMSLERFLQGL